jgi:Lipid A 3-O-deacylase (PagL)
MLRLKYILALYFSSISLSFVFANQMNIAQIKIDTIKTSHDNIDILRFTFHLGKVLNQGQPILNNIDANGHQIKGINAFALEYGHQLSGNKVWHQICNFPRAGVGVQYVHIRNRDELGHPLSFYGFYDGNYFRRKKFSITNRIALGGSLGTKKFNPADELPNDIFSTSLNAYVELGLGLKLQVHKSIYLEPGVRLTHFSNGNTKEPQKGLNIISYSIGVMSYLNKKKAEPSKIDIQQCQHRHEVLGYIGMATRQIEFNDEINNNPFETFGLNFLMANLHLKYNYEISHRIKIGAGTDLIYDGTNGQIELFQTGIPNKAAIPFKDKMKLSLFVGGESIIDRLSIVFTVGYVVAQKKFIGSAPSFEQRLGFKYHIFKDVFAGLNVRANKFRVAEALEFNVGMRKYINSN